jgi:hypothetical protein
MKTTMIELTERQALICECALSVSWMDGHQTLETVIQEITREKIAAGELDNVLIALRGD